MLNLRQAQQPGENCYLLVLKFPAAAMTARPAATNVDAALSIVGSII